MQPFDLKDIPDSVFLEDIEELTREFPVEFPQLFEKIISYLDIDAKYVYITDFIEDESKSNHFYGYFFDALNKKLHQYAFEENRAYFQEANIESLTMKDTFSIKVLNLLGKRQA